MTLNSYLLSKQPLLKKKLRVAKMKKTAEEYVALAVKGAFMFGFAAAAFIFFLRMKNNGGFILPLLVGGIIGLLIYKLNIIKIDVAIRKQEKLIDKEVLFAGRFLLVKLNSGKPLISAIEEASHGFGAATEYFKDIMRNIELGTPLEKALEQATEYCPSNRLKKILFQITNALKIGVDVTNFLEAILDEIAEEQLTEIVRYGKKLSSLTMFYMLAAIIFPSLGMTLFVVVASLISIKMNFGAFMVILVLLLFLQFIFISLFRSARPNMDI